MATSTPMAQLWRFERRRFLVALYEHPQAPRWFWSSFWGGRWQGEGHTSPGVGFQARIFGRVIEVIVWPRRIVLYSRLVQRRG